jgi:hypothetical protein
MITTDEALKDVRIRQLATRTDVFGAAGTFHQPQSIDAGTPRRWRSGAPGAAHYEAERRWPDSPFWQRRSPLQPSPD